MMYFTTEVVGKTRRKTPDGFLICLDVPIARTGRMVYSEDDLKNYKAGPDGKINVDRYAEQLFRPETIASFEGMPLTNDHPDGVMMTPEFYKEFTVGHIQNIRQGMGEWEDCLLADLFVMDQEAIAAIEKDDKVQVSAGYDAHYVILSEGKLEQTNIVGNHCALVFAGRCGPRCAVGDQATVPQALTPKKKGFKMPKPRIAELSTALTKLNDIVKTLDAAPDDMDGGTHVHVHMPSGTDDVPGSKDRRGGKDSRRMRDDEGSMMEMMDSICARLNSMEDVLADYTDDARMHSARDARFKDAGETEEEMLARKEKESKDRKARDAKARDMGNDLGGVLNPNKDKKNKDESAEEKLAREQREAEEKETADRRAKDGDMTEAELKEKGMDGRTKDSAHSSAALEEEFTKVLSVVAILAPGLSTPTFDSQQHIASTAASLCNLRKRALKAAATDEKHKAAVAPLLEGYATVDAMPCAAARVAFNAAGSIVGARHSSISGFILGRVIEAPSQGNGKPTVRTPAEINALNKAKWAR